MSGKVFVTYAWDEQTNEKVYSFVDFLRKKGINAECDKNKIDEPSTKSFTEIMNQGLQSSKVVVILSENYKRKAETGKGGVGIEYRIISSDIQHNNQKYIFVTFDGISESNRERIVPILYKSYEIIDLQKDESLDFKLLFSKLTDQRTIEFSEVAENPPVIEPIKLPQFTLKKKRNELNICRGFGEKEGKCTSEINSKNTKLCKECSLEEFKNQMYNIYSAQGYDMKNYCDNTFLATLHYGIITTKVLVGVGIYYNNEFDEQYIYNINNIKIHLAADLDAVDKVHLIVNKNLDQQMQSLAKKLDIETFTENELTQRIIDLTNYYDEFIKEYENSSLKNHYVPMSDTDGKSLLMDVVSFINNDKENGQLILGEYGFGKTTFCIHLTYRLIKQLQNNKSTYIPILIYLRDYTKSISLDELLTNFFVNKYRINNGNIQTFKQLLKYGRVLLIFDGFDEVAKRVDYDVKFRVFTEICKYATGNTKILLTCRPNYFQDLSEYSEIFSDSYLHFEPMENHHVDFKEINIRELNQSQIVRFLDSYSYEFHKNNIQIDEFYKIIRRTHDLWDLSKRPFLLSMIIETLPKIITNTKMKNEQNYSINSANLYEEYTNDWLKREDRKGKTLIKAQDKKTFCENLAFKMFIENKYEIHFRDLPKEIKNYFNKLHDINDIDYFSHDIQSCSFLKSDGHGNYSFIHNSFMEFFVAKIIVQKLCRTHQKLNTERLLKTKILDEINNILGHNYISTEICLFINDLLKESSKEKNEIQAILEGNIKHINNVAQKNSLSIMAKMGINIGPIIEKMINKKAILDLSGIDLSYSNFTNADLYNVNFSRASFYKSQISKVTFNCVFNGANFQRCKISSANFIRQNLELTDWSYSNLKYCDFSESILAMAKFDNATVVMCDFSDSEFTDINFNDKTTFEECHNMETVIGMPYDMNYDSSLLL